MRQNRIRLVWVAFCVGNLLAFCSAAEEKSQTAGNIPAPQAGSFIVDTLNIIDPVSEREINDILIALKEEKGIPFYVVVIPSLEAVGYENATIEEAAKDIMAKWKISPKTLDGKPWDRGVLLLFCKDRRKIKIRIETGAGWGKDLDNPARAVIGRVILPRFKEKQYSLGVTKGSRSLAAAIRMQTQTRPVPPKVPVPKDNEFLIDAAGLLSFQTKLVADKMCRELYEKEGVPVFVVTAASIENISRKGLQFEDLARRFFDYWPLGDEARRNAFQHRGVLLFISRNDNLVGLDFADDWGDKHSREQFRKEVIENQMLPALKENDLSRGIMSGIQGIRKCAGKVNFPKLQSPTTTTAPAQTKTTSE